MSPDFAFSSRNPTSLIVDSPPCLSSATTYAACHVRKTRVSMLMIVGFGNAFTAIDLTGYINELLDYYN
jgi:hypothetical protein